MMHYTPLFPEGEPLFCFFFLSFSFFDNILAEVSIIC